VLQAVPDSFANPNGSFQAGCPLPDLTAISSPNDKYPEETMTKLQIRRRTLLAAAPMLVAAPYAARAQGKPEKSKVVLAVGGKSALYYLSLTIAERKGFFKDAGLDVEINDFQGGAKSLQALMGGSADVVAGAYEHTIRMQQRGQPIIGFALIGRGMQLAIGLRTAVAEKVKGPADVKGMKFGVTAPGSQTNMLVNFWAAKGGLKATDIVAIGVGAGASVVAAVEKGEVDGISQADPALTILQEKKLIKIMLDTRTMKGNQELFGGAFPAACLYAQPDLLKKTPNTAQALATAIVRANEWLQKASPAEVASAVPEAYLLGDRAVYEKSFVGVRETISPDGLMPAGAMENALKFLVDGDPKIAADVGKIKLADTWTNEFAQRAGKRS
jgi:NitT/TauT family transport system substrate-binding protein